MIDTMSLAELQEESRAVGLERFTARDYRPRLVTHIVLFAFAPTTTDEQKADVARRFHALADTPRDGSPYIVSITSGAQISGEVAPGGLEYGFVVTFASLGDRNFYVGEPVVTDPAFFDPVHHEFKSFVGPLLREGSECVLVFDFAA